MNVRGVKDDERSVCNKGKDRSPSSDLGTGRERSLLRGPLWYGDGAGGGVNYCQTVSRFFHQQVGGWGGRTPRRSGTVIGGCPSSEKGAGLYGADLTNEEAQKERGIPRVGRSHDRPIASPEQEPFKGRVWPTVLESGPGGGKMALADLIPRNRRLLRREGGG